MSMLGLEMPYLPAQQAIRDARLLAEQRQAARRVVAGEAADAAELAELLSMLDLNIDERDRL